MTTYDNRKTFLTLANDILDEMYWGNGTSISSIKSTTEGKRVCSLLNRKNREIVLGEQEPWKFREQKQQLFLSEDVQSYDKPNGYILNITPVKYPAPLIYTPNWKYLPYPSKGRPVNYWIYNDKIYTFPIANADSDNFELTINYITDLCAMDSIGNVKYEMEDDTDTSIIPEGFDDILIYGVCQDLRSSKEDPKSNFYKDSYNKAYQRLLSSQKGTGDLPNGLRINDNVSIQDSVMGVFYNPYAGGNYNNG